MRLLVEQRGATSVNATSRPVAIEALRQRIRAEDQELPALAADPRLTLAD
ncbi:MAG: hypothetical protein ACTHU0_36220 [Kofleriaceae bacterium]